MDTKEPEFKLGPGPGSSQKDFDKYDFGTKIQQPQSMVDTGIGPGEEHYNKFRLGAEVDLPTSQAEVPNVEMAVPSGLNQEQDDLERRLLAEGRGERLSVSPTFDRIASNIRTMLTTEEELANRYIKHSENIKSRTNYMEPELTEEERSRWEERAKNKIETLREEAADEMPYLMEKLAEEQIVGMSDLLDEQIMRLMSPYPYESREIDYSFKNLKKATRSLQEDFKNIEREYIKKRDSDREDEDSKREHGEDREKQPDFEKVGAYLNEIESMRYWASGNLALQEAWSSGIELFWDGAGLLEQKVKMYNKLDPPAQQYHETFARELGGLETPEGIWTDERTNERLRLREKMIRYQDDDMFWKMGVSAVHQMRSQHDEPLIKMTDNERDLIMHTFGEGEWVNTAGEGGDFGRPEKILNIYTSKSTVNNKDKYIALMEALLAGDVRDRLKEIQGPNREEEIKRIAQGVKGYAERRKTKKYAYDRSELIVLDEAIPHQGQVELNDYDLKLANLVIKSGIVMDWGHMSTTQLSWGWNWDSKKREWKREEGDTWTSLDVNKQAHWANTEASNSAINGWTDSSIMPPASPEFAEKLKGISPYEKPNGPDNFPEFFEEDPALKNAWDRLWGNEIWNEDIHSDVKDQLQKMTWFWETPDKDERGRRIRIPMFIPPAFNHINFLDAVKISNDETVWEELRKGKKLSEIEFNELREQEFNRWTVTINQSVRWINTITNSANLGAREDVMKFFSEEENVPEIAKRVALGVRGEMREEEKKEVENQERKKELDTAYNTAMKLSIMPTLIVLYEAYNHNAFQHQDERDKIKKGGISGLVTSIEIWKLTINKQPREIREPALALLDFYTTVFVKYATEMSKKEEGNLTRNTLNSIKRIKEDTSIEVDLTLPHDYIRKPK